MRVKTWVFAGAVAALLLLSGAAPSAYAKHTPKPQRLKLRKDMGAYGGKYMAPKKQKPPTGYYRNSLTGQMVYGTPPQPKH
jgi:hypothetical protein